MKKLLYYLSTAAMMLAIMLTLTACGDDKPSIIDEPDNPNGNATTDYPSEYEMKKLINQHLNVHVIYSNYYWIFNVESTLHKALPNKKIEFGIGHGDINGTTNVTIGFELNGRQNVYSNYSEYYDSNNVFHAELKCPIEYYYMWGKDPQDLSAFTLCQIYNRDFHQRFDKGESNWTAEDRERIPELRNLLRKYENETMANYDISLWIDIDNGMKAYIVGYYNR